MNPRKHGYALQWALLFDQGESTSRFDGINVQNLIRSVTTAPGKGEFRQEEAHLLSNFITLFISFRKKENFASNFDP